jgi:hypothetical protein
MFFGLWARIPIISKHHHSIARKKYGNWKNRYQEPAMSENVTTQWLHYIPDLDYEYQMWQTSASKILTGRTTQTTEIYARADSKQKRETIEKASENLTPSDVIGEWVDNNDLISWLKGLGKK